MQKREGKITCFSKESDPKIVLNLRSVESQGIHSATTVKPVEFANVGNRPPVAVGPPVTEPANSYDIIRGHYRITWPPAYLESRAQFHIYCYALRIQFNPPMLGDLNSCIVSVSYCPQAEFLIH